MLDSPPVSFVVTGSGRCGTGWAAEALTALGHPCGHESYFDFRTNPATKPRFPSKAGAQEGPLEGDSAFAAGHHLHRFPPGTPILHVVRDPGAVVNSWIGTHFLADSCPCHPRHPGVHLSSKYALWMVRVLPELRSCSDELARTIRWVTAWTSHIHAAAFAAGLSYQLVRLEDLVRYPGVLTQAAEHLTGRRPSIDQARAVTQDLGTVNPHAHAKLVWQDIHAHPAGDELARHAIRLGYPV